MTDLMIRTRCLNSSKKFLRMDSIGKKFGLPRAIQLGLQSIAAFNGSTTIKKALKSLKVEVTHRKANRRKYIITGITPESTGKLTFPVDGREKHVVQYFRETYCLDLEYTGWPCVIVGNKAKKWYLPMEVCKIVGGKKYVKALHPAQTSSLVKLNNQRPGQREKNIVDIVRENNYQNDEYAEEFQIRISPDAITCQARVLPAPHINYDGCVFQPNLGHWNKKDKVLSACLFLPSIRCSYNFEVAYLLSEASFTLKEQLVKSSISC